MAPIACSVVLTLAAIGAVFLFVVFVCAFQGLRTWRAWLRVARYVAAFAHEIREADRTLPLLLQALRAEAHAAENEARDHVAKVHGLVTIGPCERQDCPRHADRRQGQ